VALLNVVSLVFPATACGVGRAASLRTSDGADVVPAGVNAEHFLRFFAGIHHGVRVVDAARTVKDDAVGVRLLLAGAAGRRLFRYPPFSWLLVARIGRRR